MDDFDDNTLVISSHEDLLALAPYAVGFQPEESVVMLGCAGRSMHARVDVPRTPDDETAVVEQLTAAATANGVSAVTLLVYSDDATRAERITGQFLAQAFFRGLAVITALRVHAGRWWALVDGVVDASPDGVPFDVSNHPITVQGVLSGQITHRNRAELAATLDTDHDAVEGVNVALAAPRPPAEDDWAARRVEAVVRRHVASGAAAADAEVAEILHALADDHVLATVVTGMCRTDAPRRLEFWIGVLRRTPGDHVARIAAVVAVAAWLAGDGALAWCAIDRSRATGEEHPIAAMVADFLERAVAPDRWGA